MKREFLQKGSITVEYLVIAVMLMVPIWYGVIGGPGAFNDIERNAKDTALPHHHISTESNAYSSSLINALDQRAKNYADQIYQP